MSESTGPNDRLLLGCHLSIGKGLAHAIDAAEDLGNNALQIFTHNVSAWAMKDLDEGRATGFRERRTASMIEFLAVHTMYLINLASPDDELHERSAEAMIEEVCRAASLGADAVVCHLGAHKGAGAANGIARIVEALNRTIAASAFQQARSLRLLLENTAGAGTTMGASFEQLATIMDSLDDGELVGICLDTCHAFAAGYDLRSAQALEETLDRLELTAGLSRLELIHLNDSMFPLGVHRDRHAHIGQGEIGEDGMRAIVNHSALRHLPFILETPKVIDGRPDADRINLPRVRSLRTEEGT